VNINIKLLNGTAVIPENATEGSAGVDITATSIKHTDNYIEYGTGLAFELPLGYCALLLPRSSISNKNLILCNSVGLLDSDYRGEVTFRFKTIGAGTDIYSIGDRIGQMLVIPHPRISFTPVYNLSCTTRGSGGYGSSGT